MLRDCEQRKEGVVRERLVVSLADLSQLDLLGSWWLRTGQGSSKFQFHGESVLTPVLTSSLFHTPADILTSCLFHTAPFPTPRPRQLQWKAEREWEGAWGTMYVHP